MARPGFRAMGEIRFPHNPESEKPGEVKVYQLSPEEVAARYGPPAGRKVRPWKVTPEWLVGKLQRKTIGRVAEHLRVPRVVLARVIEEYGIILNEKGRLEEEYVVSVMSQARVDWPKPLFIELYRRCNTGREVAEATRLPAWAVSALKKEYGVGLPQQDEIAATDEIQTEEEAAILTCNPEPSKEAPPSKLDLSTMISLTANMPLRSFEPFMAINARGLRLSCGCADRFQAGDRIEILANGEYVAARTSENGVVTRGESKGRRALYITREKVVFELRRLGWAMGTRVPLEWDEVQQCYWGRKAYADLAR